MTSPLKIELFHLPECPHVEQTRLLLQACMSELGLTGVAVADKEGDFPSPSIMVNGVDVMGAPLFENASCRIDLPTRERVMRALDPESRAKS